jgi:uncharacterized RDD family membrane protein YckC
VTDTSVTVDAPARFGRRLLAAITDGVIIGFINYWLDVLLPHVWFVEVWFPVWLAYFVFTTGLLGRTPGKMAFGIYLRSDSGRINLVTAGLREVVGKAISVMTLGVGFLVIAADREKRGFHDVIAGTRAVHPSSIPWIEEHGREVASALATAGEASPAMLERVPPEGRTSSLRAFASRYPGDVVMDGQVLRPTGAVEWF